MIFKEVKKHRFYYIFLLIIEASLAYCILVSKGDRDRQLLLMLTAAVFYAIWGIVHHSINHDFHFKVVIEYLLMAILGIAIVFFLLQ